jgi:7-cyano-7-deazaguanine synthase
MSGASKTAYVLASGGIDSTACIAYYLNLGFEVRPVFIDFGHPANPVERQHVRQIVLRYGMPLREIVLRGLHAAQAGEVKGRNAAFVTMALMAYPDIAGIIALGIHAGSPYYDCSPRFRDLMGSLVSEYTDGRLNFDAPFIALEKTGIVDFAMAHDVPLDLTYSCETGVASPCGTCPSCKDRIALGV